MLKSDEYIQEALRIVETAKEQNVHLRIMGACAVRIKCPNSGELYNRLQRELSDLDFMAYWRDSGKIEKIMEKLGYYLDRRLTAFHESHRNFFINNRTGIKVDVFYDKLNMCHEIDFKGRLELDYPTIPPTELFLEKIQIVKIGEKDIKDLIVLLLDYEPEHNNNMTINLTHIAKIMSRDWGFYYTTTLNLSKIREITKLYDVLTEEEKKTVLDRADKIQAAIDNEPKSIGWKLRAKIGSRKKWYNEVEDVVR